ncbi:MAG: ABC transporter ATP-binding protein [Lachnospiraceae bacterium]
MIEIRHLTKRYGERIAVNDISLQLEEGKIIGFLGPNGAGKSTTMNMITGYLAPSQGDVIVNEISMLKRPMEAKKRIGYLPENPPLYSDMLVEEYLRFVIELKGVAKGERDAELDRVINLTKLMGVKSRLIRNLSKGYRQRVGLAQALAGNPAILILDEPSVGLDPQQIVEIRELIRELGKQHTVILSTHILSEAQAVCDEIVILSRGRIVAQSKPDLLVEAYNQDREMELLLKTNASAAENLLSKIPGIEQMKILQEDNRSVRILLKTQTDLREKVAVTCARENITVLELNIRRVSLEEVYLKLTNDTYLDMVEDNGEEYHGEEYHGENNKVIASEKPITEKKETGKKETEKKETGKTGTGKAGKTETGKNGKPINSGKKKKEDA